MLAWHLSNSASFPFTKILNNGICKRSISSFLVVCWLFVVVCWWFVIVCTRLWRFLVVCGCCLVVCDRLCSFVVACGCLWSLPVLVAMGFNNENSRLSSQLVLFWFLHVLNKSTVVYVCKSFVDEYLKTRSKS